VITCTTCGGANNPTDRFCTCCSAFLEWSSAPAPARQHAGAGAPVPEERLPQAEQPRQAPRRVTAEGPSDFYCGHCGAGNTFGRRFCRLCGKSLDDPVIPQPEPELSWWGRLLAWFRGLFHRAPDEPLAAGERPSRRESVTAEREQDRSWWRRHLRMPTRISLGNAALPLLVLSLLGYSIAPVRAKITSLVFGAYGSARGVVAPQYVAVTPAGAKAITAVQGHLAPAAIDQSTATSWAEGLAGTGAGAVLTVTFDGTTKVDRIGFHNGAPGKDFPLQPRLRVVRVALIDSKGLVSTTDIELKDTPDFQNYALDGNAATKATVTVVSVYAGQSGSAASLTELSFHTKK